MQVFEQRRLLMIETQLRTNKVTDNRVLDAFGVIPREVFVDPERSELAYIDEDLAICHGRFLLEPMVFARLVQALDLKKEDSVLDIGAASGYSSAVLSRLVQSVVGIEKVESLAEFGQKKMSEIDVDNAVILGGALTDGFNDDAPYNAIIIEGTVEAVPESLLEQLTPDGRLVTIVKPADEVQGRALKYVRSGSGFAHSVLFDANTPVLDDFAQTRQFEFGA